MKPQYLIVGANFINKGAEAMLKTVRHQIIQRHADAQVFAICHPEEREIALRQDIFPVTHNVSPMAKKITGLVRKVTGKIGQMLGKGALPYADYSPMDEIHRISNLKMAIDVSGFAYGDKRGYIQPLETQKIIDYCKRKNAKYIFMPQAWGSFNDKQVAANCFRMINSADAYFTRDHVSRKYVSELLNLDEINVPLLPDIAFHFPIPSNDGNAILVANGFPASADRKKICISPNMRIYERMGGSGSSNEYVKMFVAIIESLKEQFEVVLIPNEILPPSAAGNDDQFLCETIFQALPDTSHVNRIKGYYSAEEIKSVIRECDIVIASRFHSLVFALSLGIPCMAISWSHKYRELFKLFELEEYVLEDKGISNTEVMTAFNKLYSEREAVAAKINEILPKLKSANAHVFDLLN